MPKRPKAKYKPKLRKQPRAEPPVSTSSLSVHWSFATFDDGKIWSDTGFSDDTFHNVAGRMKSFEGRTWGQIEADRANQHRVECTRLSSEARKRLRQIKHDDQEYLWRFRFSGARRIWGIRDGRVLRVLWWDPQHRVCPSIRE